MPHTITYNSDLNIIETIFQGDILLNEAKEVFSEAAQIAKEQNCFLFFGDHRDATMKLSTMEIYDLPRIMSEIFASLGISPHLAKRALVVRKAPKEDYEFFETVTSNRGQNTKIFQDVAEANKWLSNK